MWSPTTTTTTSTTHRVGWAGWSWSLLFLVGSLVFPILVHAGGKSVAFLPSSSPRMPKLVDNKVDQVNNELKKRLLETTSLCCSSTSTSHSVETSATLRGEPENHALCHDVPESDEEEEGEDEDEEEVSDEDDKEEDDEEDKDRTELESKCSHHNLSNCRLCSFFQGQWDPYEMIEALHDWLDDNSVVKSEMQLMSGSKQVYFSVQRYCQSEECPDDLLEQLEDLMMFMTSLFLASCEETLQTFMKMNEYVDLYTPLKKDDDVIVLSELVRESVTKLYDFLHVVSPPWVKPLEHREYWTQMATRSNEVIGKLILSIQQYLEPIIKESWDLLIASREHGKQGRFKAKKKTMDSPEEKTRQRLWREWRASCQLVQDFSLEFLTLPLKLDIKSKLMDPLGLIHGDLCSESSLLALLRQ